MRCPTAVGQPDRRHRPTGNTPPGPAEPCFVPRLLDFRSARLRIRTSHVRGGRPRQGRTADTRNGGGTGTRSWRRPVPHRSGRPCTPAFDRRRTSAPAGHGPRRPAGAPSVSSEPRPHRPHGRRPRPGDAPTAGGGRAGPAPYGPASTDRAPSRGFRSRPRAAAPVAVCRRRRRHGFRRPAHITPPVLRRVPRRSMAVESGPPRTASASTDRAPSRGFRSPPRAPLRSPFAVAVAVTVAVAVGGTASSGRTHHAAGDPARAPASAAEPDAAHPLRAAGVRG
jgi:hypothetical protein